MFATMLAATMIGTTSLPELSVRGMDLVDPNGRTVLLKGVNLGNWLVIEPWMLGVWDEKGGFRDQYEFEQILASRFGAGERERLMDLYRSHWITERDFPIIRSFGFNVVRLPMNYRLFEDDVRPRRLRKDAWQWIDRAVNLAEKYGLYTILDMHGVQGGQSVYDHTGRVGQNKLWSVPENQDRLAWLWGEIAKRYRNRSAVIAYDVFNEPYGGSHEGQKAVFSKVYREIRRFDPKKMVYAHGHYDGFEHYGNPKANGWHNVAFQMHYYPGLFGNGAPTTLTHARHLQSIDRKIAPSVKRFGVPFLVGEMNVVFRAAGGAAMMRRTFDMHAKHGWATTMWSYKTWSREGGIGDSTWAMVTNAKPIQALDVRTASKEEIETWMKSFSSQPYAVNEDLQNAMTAIDPALPPLPAIPEPIESTRHQDTLPEWTAVDLQGTLRGGLKVEGDQLTLYGAGSDIWGQQDQGRFLHQSISGNFDLLVELEGMPAIHDYAKAGLMARQSLESDSPTWLLSVFPSGSVQFAVRRSKATDMDGGTGADSAFPMRLRLTRKGMKLTAYFANGREPEQVAGTAEVGEGPLLVGLVALSHDNSQLIPVQYRNLRLVR